MAKAEVTEKVQVDQARMMRAILEYENYPKFVTGCESVKVDSRKDGEPTVASYQVSMMGKKISYTLKHQENPKEGTMQWTLLKSPDFKVDNGWWKVVSTGPQSCEVTYGLEIEFNFWVPGPVFKSLIGAALPTMLREYEEYAKTL